MKIILDTCWALCVALAWSAMIGIPGALIDFAFGERSTGFYFYAKFGFFGGLFFGAGALVVRELGFPNIIGPLILGIIGMMIASYL
jgi:hypothetical protein